MPIFQDNNGLAVKFFIQKDLAQEIQAELCETITSLGGRVEGKVPRQGYILVRIGTAEEERLRLCWTSSDRPERYFVPYTFVEACKIAGMLLKQIFVDSGAPVLMHIHPSIANVNARSHLAARIMHSGGDPNASIQSARVILADPQSDIFQHLVKTFQEVPNKYIESYLWVKKCIEKGSVTFTPMVYKNPGGRRAGEERIQFTQDDEEKLCEWIAAKIPYKEIGGRTGNRLYQQLCDLSVEPEYLWVRRHTWQSWRERYKKNAERLDKVIAKIVEEKRPQPGEKGQYGYVRRAEEKRSNKKRKGKVEDDHTTPEEYAHNVGNMTGILVPGSSQQPQAIDPTRLDVPTLHPSIPPLHHLAVVAHPYAGHLPPPLPLPCPIDNSAVRSNPTVELDDESSEWAVRVGNEPPPTWGKRKIQHGEDSRAQNKRVRLDEKAPSQAQSSQEQATLTSATVVTIAKLHVIDQGIHEIAKHFRFTVEEVEEYYDKCADMAQTRLRFQRMRKELTAKFDLES